MTGAYFSTTVEIPAPLTLVWSVIVDVERWPEWTASILRVKLLSPGPLHVGSRVRIHQPRLPPAFWHVTELIPNVAFTWVSRVPGLRVTARHALEAVDTGSRATLSIRYEGLLGSLLARWVGELNMRYLVQEANGLEVRCAALTAKQIALNL